MRLLFRRSTILLSDGDASFSASLDDGAPTRRHDGVLLNCGGYVVEINFRLRRVYVVRGAVGRVFPLVEGEWVDELVFAVC